MERITTWKDLLSGGLPGHVVNEGEGVVHAPSHALRDAPLIESRAKCESRVSA